MAGGGSKALVFVTGASSGIGRALVAALPYRSARVIGLSRRVCPNVSESVSVDLAEPAGWLRAAELFAQEVAAFGGEQVVLVHAAGTLSPIGFAGEVDPDVYRRNILLNAAAPAVLGDAFLRALRSSSARGLLLLVTSGAASHVYEGWSGYGCGKAGLDQWARVAGAEQARRGGRCRVLAVAPGVVETPMQAEIRETAARNFPAVERFREMHAQGVLRDTEAVARDIWALAARDLPNGAVVDLRELTD